MWQGVEPFATWFYDFAWWSYILILNTAVHRLKGQSLIINRFREFLWLLPVSVFIWVIFEAFNLRLENWHYLNLPRERWVRWGGYALAYATVLPGIFLTRDLLEALGLFKNGRVSKPKFPPSWPAYFYGLGISALILPLIFPRYTFPLVWVGFVFLLEPLVYRHGGLSLMRAWEGGELRPLLLLLFAGLICGGLWEFWNYWAKAKWVYTVPFFNQIKVFEMPLAGFLGFLPFAVECLVMVEALKWVYSRAGTAGRVTLGLAGAAFIILIFRAIDTWTVRSYA
jgi:hypothetical protein